jgi:hypothetical protein
MLANSCQVMKHALYAKGIVKSVSRATIEGAQFAVVVGKRTWGNSSQIGCGAKLAREQAGVNHLQPICDNGGLNIKGWSGLAKS